MIHPVNFAGTAQVQATPANFQELINKPQAYVKQDAQAASKLEDKNKKGGSFGKKLLKLIIAAGVITGAVVLGGKKNIFAPKEGGNKILETIKKPLNSLSDAILKNIDKIKNKAPEAAEKLSANA